MVFKSKWYMLGLAALLGVLVLILPRPEGTRFKILGDPDQTLLAHVGGTFRLLPGEKRQT